MEEITLAALLRARELRAEKQRALLAEHPGDALICLTVNTPGPVKRGPLPDRVFAAGLRALDEALRGTVVSYRETVDSSSGLEGYRTVKAAPLALKRVCCGLENGLPFGRLLDIDVLGTGGVPLSRRQMGLPERGCIVCGREGAYCASRRLHPLTEILAAYEALAKTVPEEETGCGSKR